MATPNASGIILFSFLSLIHCVAAEYYHVGSTVGSIVFLIILVLDIIAAIEILRSDKSMVEKLLWIIFIVLCPLIGLVVYLIFGRARSLRI